MNIDYKVLLLFNWLTIFKKSPMQLSCSLGVKVHYFLQFNKVKNYAPTSIYIYIHSNHHRLVSA